MPPPNPSSPTPDPPDDDRTATSRPLTVAQREFARVVGQSLALLWASAHGEQKKAVAPGESPA